jgi:uncharacterized membrane protein YdjX (TVP38/TMEM64 family)
MLARWLPVFVLVAIIAVAWASGATRYLTLASIAEHRDTLKSYVDANFVPALAAYMGIYVVAIALSLPGGALLTVLGGFLFGWLTGGMAAMAAAAAGATVIFLIARTSFGAILAEKAGPRVRKLAQGFRDDAFSYMLFLRLVPLFPFWLVNIAPALFNVSLAVFFTATLIGIVPATMAFAILGSGLDSIIAAQREAYQACLQAQPDAGCKFALDAGALITPQLLAAFAALGVVALMPVIWKRHKAKRRGKTAEDGAHGNDH